jgi:DNA repair photolyase
MDLVAELSALLDLRVGDTLDDARLLDISIELGLRYVFDLGEHELVVEVDPITEGRKFAARSRYFTFGYRVGDRAAPVDSAVGRALCERVATRAALHEEGVLSRLRAEDPSAERIREVRGVRILERGGTPTARYWTLSPYVGCLIGCRFCYAPSRLDPIRRLAGLPPVAWGSWVDARVDAPELLARELSADRLPIKLCPIVSDPYHAIERKMRLTRRCLEVLRDAAPRDVYVLTRSAAIIDDASLLASMPRAHAGVSLPTVDDEVRRYFEPRGSSVDERLAALDVLRSSGIDTFAIVQPMFPGSVDALADALAARVRSVRIDVLYGTYAADFSAFPEAADDRWQRERASELATALIARNVAIWPGELPTGRA